VSIMLVPDGLDGERIDSAAARMTGMSRARIADLLNGGQIQLAGEVVSKASTRVAAGMMLEVSTDQPVRVVQPTYRLAPGLTVIHQDADIVVLDKPAGVAAHPSLGWDGPSVTEHLAAAGIRIATGGAPERQGVVQRLDVGTSGLMVLARSEVAYSALKQAFRDRVVHKVYLALVQGHPDPFEGTIDAPIGRDRRHDWKMAVTHGGRASITHYETVEAHRAATLLKVHLESGRTHQIRVHLSALGHPCVGDPLYGSDPTLAAKLGLQRQWLHASELGFIHPHSGEMVHFASPIPPDLALALAKIRPG